jgi:two-component sensor histidine kinase
VLSPSAAFTNIPSRGSASAISSPRALAATEFKTEIEMNAIRLKQTRANRRVGAARDVAEVFDTHVPSIAPWRIHGFETISLSEPLLDEWNHRLKNNLQILVDLLESGYRNARNSQAREVLSDAIRRIEAVGTAQQHQR